MRWLVTLQSCQRLFGDIESTSGPALSPVTQPGKGLGWALWQPLAVGGRAADWVQTWCHGGFRDSLSLFGPFQTLLRPLGHAQPGPTLTSQLQGVGLLLGLRATLLGPQPLGCAPGVQFFVRRGLPVALLGLALVCGPAHCSLLLPESLPQCSAQGLLSGLMRDTWERDSEQAGAVQHGHWTLEGALVVTTVMDAVSDAEGIE